MEKKENKTRLRLVTTDETRVSDNTSVAPEEPAQLHSKFAGQMNNFADELDRMIELIMRS